MIESELIKLYSEVYLESGKLTPGLRMGHYDSMSFSRGTDEEVEDFGFSYTLERGRIPIIVRFVDEYPEPFVKSEDALFTIAFEPQTKSIYAFIRNADKEKELDDGAKETGKRIISNIIQRYDRNIGDPLVHMKSLSPEDKAELMEALTLTAEKNFGPWGAGKE